MIGVMGKTPIHRPRSPHRSSSDVAPSKDTFPSAEGPAPSNRLPDSDQIQRAEALGHSFGRVAVTESGLAVPASSVETPGGLTTPGSGAIQRYGREDSEDSEDSDYMEWESDAPTGYMDPSDYRDAYGGGDHSDLEDKVWVAKISGWPALWWVDPVDTVSNFKLLGSRSKDFAALTGGGTGSGLTWHHCADYRGGRCTMQLVPTSEHSSWGHRGAAAMAGYSD